MRTPTLALIAAFTIAAPALAHAETDFAGGKVSANAALSSDYINRGISRTRHQPSLGAHATYTHDSGVYAGVDANTTHLRIDKNARLEIAPKAGYKGTLYDNRLKYDGGVRYTGFVGGNSDLPYWDIYLSGLYDFDAFVAGLSWSYSPDYINKSGSALYYGGDIAIPIVDGIKARGHMGLQFVDKNTYVTTDYMDWGIGATYNYQDLFDVNADYTDTNLRGSECRERCSARVTVGISKSF